MEWIWLVVLGVPAALAVGVAHRRRTRQLRIGTSSRAQSRWAPYSTDHQAAYYFHGGDGGHGGTGHGSFGGDAGCGDGGGGSC